MRVFYVKKNTTSFLLGRRGENESMTIMFPVADWLEAYPGATIALYNKRPHESESYPVVIGQPENGYVAWIVGSTELALDGEGTCELVAVEGTTVEFSKKWDTKILDSLDGGGDAPDEWESWLTEFTTLKGEAEDAAEAAEAAQGAAEDARDAIEGMGAEATTLAAGSSATVTKTVDQQTGAVTLTFGIPAGEKGETGERGPAGETGPAGPAGETGPAGTAGKDGKDAVVDDTLTQPGQAADAAKTGEAISQLNGAINAKADEPGGTKSAGKVYGLNNNLEPEWVEQSGGGSVDPQDIEEAVDAWLTEYITNPDNPPLDRSLSSSSAAAPADLVGNLKYITTEEKTTTETNEIEFIMHDGYLAQTGIKYETGNYLAFGYTDKIPVQTGDVIKGYNGSTALQDILVLCEYNGDTFVSGYNPKSFPYTVPEGVTNIAVSANTTYKSTLRMTLTRTEAVLVPVLIDRVVVLENSMDGKVDKDGSKQVHAKNCQFMVYSRNLFNETELTIGLLNKNTGAVLPNYTDYRTSDWIEVEGSENYIFSCSNANGITVYLCWYKSDKTYISGEETSIAPTLQKTAPSNAKYIRFSILNAHREYKVQFENGSTATDYMKYGTGYLLPEYAPVVNENFILNLPAKVYALVGTEMNIYFDNLVEGHDDDYVWDVTCSTQSIGMQLERGYRVVASTAGTYTLTFTAKRKSDGSSVTKSTSLIIVGASAGSGNSASVIILGDSTTDGGIAVSKIHENLTNDEMTVTTLGTRGVSPNNHEGRSGWRFSFYFTKASETYTDGRGTIYNPFYNPNTQTFDANYYFTNSGIEKPDYFFINLGINDMFGAMSDLQLDSAIEPAIEYCDDMIESVQDASPSTKVCVCLTIPPNYSQDAFGREYKTGQNRNRYKRNNLLWVKRLMEEYEGRENEGIYVIPINLSLDTRYNMGFDTQPVNARNTDVTYQMPIGNGGVHPVTSGYWQIADVYTAFLKGNAT